MVLLAACNIPQVKMDGWKESDHFPDNEDDYVRMGLY